MKELRVVRRDGANLLIHAYSNYVNAKSLVAATAASITPPSEAKFITLIPPQDLWILLGSSPTAAIPAADVTDGSASQLVPGGVMYTLALDGAASISLISAVAQIVSIVYYS